MNVRLVLTAISSSLPFAGYAVFMTTEKGASRSVLNGV
jgi:hypothetical protein